MTERLFADLAKDERGLKRLPIPVSVEAHPYQPGRFTHLVSRGDARARGWLTLCDLPLGLWRSRPGALRAARRMELRGVVTLRGGHH